MNCQAQKLASTAKKCILRSVTGMPLDTRINIFLNDLEHGTLSKFVDDTALGDAAGTAKGCAAVHRDLVM